MNSWNTLLTVYGQILGQVRIQRGIFQGDSLSPLLFVAALIPLTIILRQTQLGYQISKYSTKISHLHYMDDLKLHEKSTAELESLLNIVRYSAMTYRWNLAKTNAQHSPLSKVTSQKHKA